MKSTWEGILASMFLGIRSVSGGKMGEKKREEQTMSDPSDTRQTAAHQILISHITRWFRGAPDPVHSTVQSWPAVKKAGLNGLP